MIFTTFQGQDLALCLLEPDWNNPVKVSLTLPSQVDRSLSGKESRRAFAKSMRYELDYQAQTMTNKETTDLRLWVNRLGDTKVAVPLWPDRVYLSQAAVLGATAIVFDEDKPARWGQYWVISDGTNAEIVQVTAVSDTTITLAVGCSMSWTAGAWAAPLLFGRLDSKPELDDDTDEIAHVELHFVERSSWDFRITAAPGTIPTVGANVPNFAALKLFTARPDFSDVSDSSEEDSLEQVIGFLREEERIVYPSHNRRTISYDFTGMSRAEISDVERLWTDRLGVVRLFMAPTWLAEVRLSDDVGNDPDSDIVLTGEEDQILQSEDGNIFVCEGGAFSQLKIEPSRYTDPDYAIHPRHPYLALLDADHIEPCKVTGISGNTLTLAAEVTNSFSANKTTVSALMLSRFSDTKLEWSYTTDTLATTTIKLIEAPEEYATGPIDLPVSAFCYKFYINFPAVQYFRFTSHERPVTVAGDGTYQPASFDHTGGKNTADLDNDELDITSWVFDGNPLSLFFPFQLEKPLKIELREVDVDAGTATLRYMGEVSSCEYDGLQIKATVTSLGELLNRRFPRFYIQSTCNYQLFSGPCKLLADNWKIECQLDSSDDGQTIVLSGIPESGISENYFAAGWLVTGEGQNQQWRSILTSTASADGAPITLTLNRPLNSYTVGQEMVIYPGCDGSRETCRNKFNNYINFGGHAFVPNGNPTINALPTNSSGGGKK